MHSPTTATLPLAHGHHARVRDDDPLKAGYWPYITPCGPAAAARPPDAGSRRDPPEPDPTHYLFERYSQAGGRHLARRVYYLVRPAVPRRAQLAMRRAFVRRQRAAPFPRWPVESLLVDGQLDHVRGRLRDSGENRLAFVNFWPHGKRFCAVLTHDVEGPAGVRQIPRVLEVEQRHGFRSSWNFVAEDYDIPASAFDEIRSAGGEVGLHGIKHDGKLFASRTSFDANLPKIHRYLDDWEAAGFRSPAMHRNSDWMPEIGSSYDTSFPDTDPFEPQPGGCCSIFPFFLDDMVELPVTLVQDHTLFEILREHSIARWISKSEWVMRNHGLVNLITHPDYMLRPERLDLYEQFLVFLKGRDDGWHALPRDVAAWWRVRATLTPESVLGAVPPPVPPFRATPAFAREERGDVVLDAAPSHEQARAPVRGRS
jgi:peptidoglycan/xylan/chitin deacetylase (PgdA/CDA1 family)